MKLRLTNNAESTLAGAVDELTTTVLLAPGTGVLFPVLASGEFFPMTLVKLVDGEPRREITYVTARNIDSCTVLRAQENTIASAFGAGDYAGCNPTAGVFSKKADLDGASFTGPVDLADQPLTGAVLKDCTLAMGAADQSNIIDLRNGAVQSWAPPAGVVTLTINGWPPAGTHGELLIYGTNLGAATIAIAGAPVNWINADNGTFTRSTSMSSNSGIALQTAGLDFVLLWSPDGGVTRYGKVVR